MDTIERIQTRVGNSAATLLVVDSSSERNFLGADLVVAAVLYLISKYLEGFFKAIGKGVEHLGETHAEQALALLTTARTKPIAKSELQNIRNQVSKALDAAYRYRANTEAKAAAEATAVRLLIDRGIIEGDARMISLAISEEALGNVGRK